SVRRCSASRSRTCSGSRSRRCGDGARATVPDRAHHACEDRHVMAPPPTPARFRRDQLAADPPYVPDVPSEPTLLDIDALPDELSIVGSRLERVDLAAARLPGLRMVDAVLHTCNLANVQAHGASLV